MCSRSLSVLLLTLLVPATAPVVAQEQPPPGTVAEPALRGGTTPVPPQPEPTAAEEAAEKTPLWSFVWLSDMHLDGTRLESMAKCLHYIDAELQPHFVLLTGDNNAHADPPADPSRPEPLGVRQQRFLKAFLEEHLKRSFVLITGDNWRDGFDQVFGPHQFSFDCGGLHFMLLDPDRVHHGAGLEGLSVFEEKTWEWMRQDLDRHRDQATIVAIHEPVIPPTFLDAPRLLRLLDRYPNVVAVLQGHLHIDLEFQRDGTLYLVAPSLGRSPSPALKVLDVHPEGLVVRTVADAQAQGRWELTSRRQKIAIPPALRGRLGKPSGPRFVAAEYSYVPAHPIVDDPALAPRAGELFTNALEMLLPAKSPPTP